MFAGDNLWWQREMVDGKFQKVTALAWAPNAMRLAVACADRSIMLFDENGDHKENFPTKPAEKVEPRMGYQFSHRPASLGWFVF